MNRAARLSILAAYAAAAAWALAPAPPKPLAATIAPPLPSDAIPLHPRQAWSTRSCLRAGWAVFLFALACSPVAAQDQRGWPRTVEPVYPFVVKEVTVAAKHELEGIKVTLAGC
jgi:hypothetical protein